MKTSVSCSCSSCTGIRFWDFSWKLSTALGMFSSLCLGFSQAKLVRLDHKSVTGLVTVNSKWWKDGEFGIRDIYLVLGHLEDSSLVKGTINCLSNIVTGGGYFAVVGGGL